MVLQHIYTLGSFQINRTVLRIIFEKSICIHILLIYVSLTSLLPLYDVYHSIVIFIIEIMLMLLLILKINPLTPYFLTSVTLP